MSTDGKTARPEYTVEQRLLLHRRIKKSTGCWIWTASISETGYGRLRLPQRLHYVHRLAYETFVGPIPDGLHIDHLCHSWDSRCPGGDSCPHRACFNPAHLQAVTCRENVLRGASPGARNLRRTHCPKRGHAYAEHGVVRAGRLVCRACRIEYMRGYRVTPRDESVDRRRKASA